MKGAGIIAVVVIAALAGGGGYWYGAKGRSGSAVSAPEAASADGGAKPRKLLYYRNPMGLPDTSPVPKKDTMGMDYIAVYEGDDAGADGASADAGSSARTITISTEKIQKLGVRAEAAQMRTLDRSVRATGRIEADERRLYAIAPKFEGYVERLHVNVTGQPVARGQPLFEVYSPELVSAQREYLIARQGVDALKGAGGSALSGMQQLAESSLARLKNWDISEEQVQALAKSGETRRTLTFRSPVSGIVTEKKALQGMRFMPGEALYQIADLSAVWVIADVVEQDIALVKNGARADIRINAYPDKRFAGRVSYIYPTLKPETRSIAVRIELANPGLLLKPAMFAEVELPLTNRGSVLTVPVSAVLDSGARQMVLVQLGEGRFEPREVRLGARGDNYVEVLSGLKNGEVVVTAANFLIDAESNLKAALGGFAAAAAMPAVPPAAVAAPAADNAPPPVAAPRATGGASHRADGVIEGIDPKDGTLTLNHGAVASLGWPAMTMEFKLANASLLKNVQVGTRVSVEFVQRQPDEWVITRVTPARTDDKPAADPHAAHAGH
jgi:Cu(I)/Ag(I) efflux system membrane fusion protein